MKKQNNAIVMTAIISGVILVIALVVLLTFKPVTTSGQTVNVQGIAEVKAMPDLIGIYINVQAKGNISSEAQSQVDEIFDDLISELLKIGLERKDIVTESYNVREDYDWTDEGREDNGYLASHRVSIKLDIDQTALMSLVLDQATEVGATISYLNFELTQESQNKYKAEAMKLAAKDARIKAESVAEGFDKKIGKLVSVEVNNFGYYPWRFYDGLEYAEEGRDAVKTAMANIQPGEEEISASVSAIYKLR